MNKYDYDKLISFFRIKEIGFYIWQIDSDHVHLTYQLSNNKEDDSFLFESETKINNSQYPFILNLILEQTGNEYKILNIVINGLSNIVILKRV